MKIDITKDYKMKINISTEKGVAILNEELGDVQKHSRVRTITAEDVLGVADAIENELSISKVALAGCEFSVDLNAQRFPRAYRYAPESTIVDLLYTNGHWVVTDIRRDYTHGPASQVISYLTDKAKDALVDNYLRFVAV